LHVDKEEMIRRNSQRKFCLGIKGDFPVVSTTDEERCRVAGGTIGTRPDDEPAKFATRWDEFMNRTYPVIEKYQKQGIVHEIDGMKLIDEVHAAVMKVIDSF
jgi:adenylate kinase